MKTELKGKIYKEKRLEWYIDVSERCPTTFVGGSFEIEYPAIVFHFYKVGPFLTKTGARLKLRSLKKKT